MTSAKEPAPHMPPGNNKTVCLASTGPDLAKLPINVTHERSSCPAHVETAWTVRPKTTADSGGKGPPIPE